MSSFRLPKPEFKAADETSISLKLSLSAEASELLSIVQQERLKLQYKNAHEPWEHSKSVVVSLVGSSTGKSGQNDLGVSISAVNVEDLEPGTPYSVRLIVIDENQVILQTGPETVFDTAPVDCTPKKKSCLLS